MQSLQQTGTLAEYLDFWLDHARGRVRAKTWEAYECLVRAHAWKLLPPLPLPLACGAARSWASAGAISLPVTRPLKWHEPCNGLQRADPSMSYRRLRGQDA